jgi:hypothetical protein
VARREQPDLPGAVHSLGVDGNSVDQSDQGQKRMIKPKSVSKTYRELKSPARIRGERDPFLATYLAGKIPGAQATTDDFQTRLKHDIKSLSEAKSKS